MATEPHDPTTLGETLGSTQGLLDALEGREDERSGGRSRSDMGPLLHELATHPETRQVMIDTLREEGWTVVTCPVCYEPPSNDTPYCYRHAPTLGLPIEDVELP